MLLVGAGVGIATSRGADHDLRLANESLDSLGSGLSTARAGNAALLDEIETLTRDRDSLQLVNQSLEGDNDSLASSAARSQAEADSALEEARTTAAENRTRNGQLDNREARLNDTRTELDLRELTVSDMERTWAANTIPGGGVFIVGADIDPGLYKADASRPGSCYYARLRGLSGSLKDIIDNNNVSGPVALKIGATDRALEVSGCNEFHKVG